MCVISRPFFDSSSNIFSNFSQITDMKSNKDGCFIKTNLDYFFFFLEKKPLKIFLSYLFWKQEKEIQFEVN